MRERLTSLPIGFLLAPRGLLRSGVAEIACIVRTLVVRPVSVPHMAPLAAILLAGVLAWAPAQPAAAQETLQLDSFVSGQPVAFQAGFAALEIGAVRLEPSTIECPCKVNSVTFLYGGDVGENPLGIHIWEDADNSDAEPGTEIFSRSYMVTASDSDFQNIDLSQENVIVNGPFRVGIELVIVDGNGLPSLATDLDGTIDADNNFILADFLGSFLWFQSSAFGVTGDFIIRATIDEAPPPVPSIGAPGFVLLAGVVFSIAVVMLRRLRVAQGQVAVESRLP